ncbi:MAG: hypothetical protein C5B49_08210 [Bdellovibrio sp.]|nr:MAG: hypothetical protein C5B49_08210 [Bdellovibrio sp.]
MIKAIRVVADDNFNITVDLEDGRTIRFEMNFIKSESGPVVDPLRQIFEFKKVFVRNGIVTWPSGYDIDPYFLVERGVPVDKDKTA